MTRKRFKVVDDYLIEYDGDYFDLHKPSDIRSLVTVIRYITDENEQLKQKILDEIDLEVAYVNEVYSDGRMSIEQYDGAIICLQELRGKFE